ncbi:sulfite oxidase-like oxidoreductase [Ferrimicrobium acidiphilum]|uniref:sulfite oxidase-like oxidoreductase n=1 Tax=Ferrimicrobium acidiphilum TaxID=121039 RepID=UPI0023F123FF|nr:sulfite oxidase-like oxidoreductase [Ferrimicrobium acidiphilum]
MSFFDRNRKELERRGISPDRLPPGQYMTDRFPVLHAGEVPIYPDLSQWSLRIEGLVDRPTELSYDELIELGLEERTTDIHCVTKWSKFDTVWRGIPIGKIIELARPQSSVTHIIAHAEHGFTTNIPYQDALDDPICMLAVEFDGEPLDPEHGYPVRFLLPHLYFWKSAKWLRGLEFRDSDAPGFWERNGYHNYGDPWQEQRYWGS